jgi:hypothetical protein
MISYNIISQLRKYPSVGMPGDDDLFGEGEYQKKLKKLKDNVPDVIALADSIRLLANESNNLSAELESLSTLQEGQNAVWLSGVKSATFLLEREKALTKSFGLTAKASAVLSAAYSKTAQNIGISDELMGKYRMSINKILPGMSANIKKTGAYGESLFRTNDLLQQHIGLTEDQTNSLTLAAAATGTDLATSVINTQKFAKAYEDATGEAGVFKDLMEGVASTSIELRSEYSRFPGSLEVATLKARRLGMSMADIDKSATSLLDIESSVGKELEYQLISGKRIVDAQGNSLTNKLREAKLSGNAEEQANAMTEILSSQSDIIEKGNYLQKQALAEAMGMTTEQLVASNAQMKLQEQIYQKMKDANKLEGADGRVIKSSFELTTDDLKAGIEKFGESMTDVEKEAAIKELKKTESLLTPAEQQVDLLKQIAEKGIRIITGKGDYGAKLDEMVSGIDQSRGRMETGTAYLNKEPTGKIGKSQTISQMATGFIDEIEKYVNTRTSNPITTPLINAATIVVKGMITTMHGTKVQGTEKVEPIATNDAFMMHDGIIKFDDRDKFTMIASPYGAMHESVADKITGGGGGAGLDANTIAKAIQQAITAGLSNVSWAVNLDPMAVDKAIKFNSGRLNS